MTEIWENLSKILNKKREELKREFNRVLPSNELLYDRFSKAEFLGFGKGSSVYDSSLIFGNVIAGKKVWVGPFTILDGYHADLKIGDFVTINSGVQIYTHDSTDHYLSGGTEEFKKGKVEIGDNCVIGSMSIIGKGVTIGRNSLVWANSLVVKDVPDFSIAAGSPAKIIGKIEIKEGKVIKTYFKKEEL